MKLSDAFFRVYNPSLVDIFQNLFIFLSSVKFLCFCMIYYPRFLSVKCYSVCK